MSLSSDLISQFVKITKDEDKTKKETTVYGTARIRNGVTYVQIDGSELLTPVAESAGANDGERVTVLIKNHKAILNGNLDSPAARTGDVSYLGDSKLDVDTANITYATITQLKAAEADIFDLSAEHAEFASVTADTFQAVNTKIQNLEAKNFDAVYANIDFSNIGKAAMEYFYSQSGLIEDVVVGDMTLTGKLAGVTITGDLIEGNTVKADKLVIKGSDGLYYKLNTDGMKVEAEQTDENSINGSVIKAQSITATKISVDDLVAFDATIGGFNITEDSIYSGVKESVDNNTRGVYLDNDGQVAFGDANNYIKYFKDTDGLYKLTMRVDSLSISGNSDIGASSDNAQIGIRNLIVDSASEPIDANPMNRNWSAYALECEYVENYKDSFCAARIVECWTGIQVFLNPLIDELNAGDQLTFSVNAANESDAVSSICFYLMQFDSNGAQVFVADLDECMVDDIPAGVTRRVSYTHTVDQATIDLIKSGGNVRLTLQLEQSDAYDTYFYAPKLERGNKATDWTPAPEDVDYGITEAAKTASNFVSYDSTNGVQIGNKTSGSWSGFRTQITNYAFNILSSAGDVLASYGERLIELGKNATDAIIKLCGGKGQIAYISDSGKEYLDISADKIRVRSEASDAMSSLYSMYTDESTRWEKSAVNVSPTKVSMYASECIDPSLNDMLEGWNTTELNIDPDGINFSTPGIIKLVGSSVHDGFGPLVSAVHGSFGIWKYRKYSNGEVELWGSYPIYDLACTNALGSFYRTVVFNIDPFPFAVYNPYLTASYESNGYGAMLWATTETTSNAPPSYYLVRPTSATIVSGKIVFHVRGKWAT